MKRFLIFAVLALALCVTVVLIGSTNNSKVVCTESANKAECTMSNAQAMNSATCPMAAKSNESKTCSKEEASLNKDTCEGHAASPDKDSCSKQTE